MPKDGAFGGDKAVLDLDRPSPKLHYPLMMWCILVEDTQRWLCALALCP